MKKISIFLAFTLFSIFNFAKVDFKGYEIEGSLGVGVYNGIVPVGSGFGTGGIPGFGTGGIPGLGDAFKRFEDNIANIIKNPVFPTLDVNLAFEPKWGAKLPNNTSVEFGPKLTLNQSIVFHKSFTAGITTANVGFSTDFNFAENKPVKGYLGLEIGLGGGAIYSSGGALPRFNGIGKVSGGAKINNHKIGAYLGYGKGIFGVEYGYTVGK